MKASLQILFDLVKDLVKEWLIKRNNEKQNQEWGSDVLEKSMGPEK